MCWSALEPEGQAPLPRQNAVAAVVRGGSELVVFGGWRGEPARRMVGDGGGWWRMEKDEEGMVEGWWREGGGWCRDGVQAIGCGDVCVASV
eukprot:1519491-Rhodomonas_salina.2